MSVANPPGMTRAIVRAALPLALLSPLLLGTGGFRADNLACEERVLQLEECCPSLDPRTLDCEYGEGCEGEPYPPVILPEEGECIAELDCERIRAAQICERVEIRQAQLDNDEFDSSLAAARESALCP